MRHFTPQDNFTLDDWKAIGVHLKSIKGKRGKNETYESCYPERVAKYKYLREHPEEWKKKFQEIIVDSMSWRLGLLQDSCKPKTY